MSASLGIRMISRCSNEDHDMSNAFHFAPIVAVGLPSYQRRDLTSLGSSPVILYSPRSSPIPCCIFIRSYLLIARSYTVLHTPQTRPARNKRMQRRSITPYHFSCAHSAVHLAPIQAKHFLAPSHPLLPTQKSPQQSKYVPH
jgi:hypothetical protein